MTIEIDESQATGEWAREGIFQVAPGVYRIPLPMPNDGLRSVNVYLIDTPGNLTIIDSGWSVPESRQLLIEGLRCIDATPAEITRFLITHQHRDHYEQSLVVRREFGTTVALGQGERPGLEWMLGPDFVPGKRHVEQLYYLGASDLADYLAKVEAESPGPRALYEWPDEWLEPSVIAIGEERALEVVETPGHTSGHVVFHDLAAGLLFAGDHVLPTITPSIGYESIPAQNPLGAFLASLAKLRARPDAILLPAHGPVHPSVHVRVDELAEHHARRLDQTESALRLGCTTAFEVAGVLPWTRRERTFAELDRFNSMLATTETGAHLDLLVAQGRADVEIVDAVRRYSLAGSGQAS